MLFLYLVQHAQAKAKEEDPKQGLTEEGLKNAQKVATYLADLKVEVDAVFHSGKERARATAEILAEKLGLKGRVFEEEGLLLWMTRIFGQKNLRRQIRACW